jgi:hypothetical protein
MIIEKYKHGDSEIDIIFNDDVYIHATDICKNFNKRPETWLKTQQTQDYISALKSVLPDTELVTVNNGGINPGTWIHPKLAIMFGRWLSPQFAVWCDGKIDELLNSGYVGVNDAIQESLEEVAPDIKAIKSYVRRTGGGMRINKLLDVLSAMEASSHTLNDYRSTLAGITSAASTEDREKVYNKLIKGTYKAYEDGKIERRTQEDVLQILNANLIKLLRRRQTDLINKLSSKGKVDVTKYLDEIAELKTRLEELEGQLDDPRPVKFDLRTIHALQDSTDALQKIDDEGYKSLFQGILLEDNNKQTTKHPDWKGDNSGINKQVGAGLWINDGYYYVMVGTNRKPFSTFCKLELYQSPSDEDVYVGADPQKRHFGTFNHVTGNLIVYRKK